MESLFQHRMVLRIRRRGELLTSGKGFLTLLLMGVGLFLFVADGSNEALSQEKGKKQLTLFVTQFGSIGYNHGIAIAEVLNKHCPQISARSIETLGMSDAVKQIQDPPNQTIALAYNGSSNRLPNKEGMPPLNKPADVKALFVTMETGYCIMTKNAKVRTVYDLQDKRVNVGSPAAFFVFAKYCEALGLKFSKTIRTGQNQGKDAIVDGTLDASIATWWKAGNKWAPSPAAQELIGQAGDGRLISVPKEAMEKIRKIYPEAWYIEAPAGAFGAWQKEPLGLFDQFNGFFVHPNFPEDLAYEIVKAVATNAKEVANYHASLGALVDPAFLASLPPELDFADYHPGAIRYFKEIGSWKNR